MKIIIPMAGEGSRLRPHTLITPKPLIQILGKPILKRLLESLFKSIEILSIKEIVFIIGKVGKKIEKQLIKISNDIGFHKIVIYYQEKPLGTADALIKAKNSLIGPIIIAFSDTLFYNDDFKIIKNTKIENIIWTKKVKNPNLFGIVESDPSGIITRFIEKPKNNVSNLAIIGFYYFKNSSFLKKELQYILDHNIKNKQEYQLTSALENMRKKGIRFTSKQVQVWMDFGNKKRTISSNSKILSIESKKSELIHEKTIIKNSFIIRPCFIGENTIIENSIIGPYVSIGKFTKIKNSNIKKSLIQDYTIIQNVNIYNSIIGSYTSYIEMPKKVNLGDHSILNF
ncbi:sugar phosphate nucleotidyltransferase [Blattabacterium sp. (Cryptocercus punctulatus) str. Cpu]|uniref:sugar phosphate nucleotidyltransferase n=1 Tax=Blattabacterium sp. (Cryptocercus punctulatus) str. Cpu TaxID=1075399 RepID=UPI00023871E4|nr:sugar phosphate nucleotidyltransferase [Blattabacterium sp. (Cryptocercus punctulatus) str. Cpu]AEU09600.1 UTP-glucose-1-phosphate uridylyltransferase [Blattabacterium sp. (Cryptocercus punctulatus) str. Cpu]